MGVGQDRRAPQPHLAEEGAEREAPPRVLHLAEAAQRRRVVPLVRVEAREDLDGDRIRRGGEVYTRDEAEGECEDERALEGFVGGGFDHGGGV